MSFAARHALVAHRNTLFGSDAQRQDLLDPSKTSTALIAALTYISIEKNHMIRFTAIHSDHHDDSALNPVWPHEGTHRGTPETGGFGADFWFAGSPLPDDWLEPGDHCFDQGLADLAHAPFLRQIGVSGEADTAACHALAGPTCFSDGGGAHIHLGVNRA